MSNKEICDIIKEMMNNWNATEARAKEMMPNASDEEIYQATSAAMTQSLGI